MKNHVRLRFDVLVFSFVLTWGAAWAEDWSRFRGPNGSGVVEDGEYPAEFGPDKNLIWKSAARPGKSSPVLTERQVFLTAFDEGKLYTQCFDRRTGKLVWERFEERPREAQMNRLNEPAANSPVTDGENVYVLFRDAGLISYDPAGKLRWKTPLGPFATIMGHSSSPIFAGGQIIVEADQSYDSYIAAFDPANGEIRWKIARDERDGWATPLIYEPRGGEPLILTASRGWFGAHKLSDGSRLWGLNKLSPAIVASPVVVGDTVYVFGYGNEPDWNVEGAFAERDKDGDGKLTREEIGGHAFMIGISQFSGDRDSVLTMEEWMAAARATIAPSSLVAYRFEGEGGSSSRAAAQPRELWRYERSFVGVIPSALVYQGILYLIKNGGILETFDPETGEVLKRGRVRDAIEGYSASPVAADGKVYLTSEGGKVAVLEAGRDWEVIAVNDLGEEAFGTPALSGGKIFVRTRQGLYCFGEGE
jgi:outer membrane protein assembly factor BamB